MSTFRYARTVLLGLALVAPAQAAEHGAETLTIRIARPASTAPAVTRRLERRIAAAALEVCGASPYSVPDMKDAVKHSPCWRESYAAGIAQMRDPARSPIVMLSLPRSTGKP